MPAAPAAAGAAAPHHAAAGAFGARASAGRSPASSSHGTFMWAGAIDAGIWGALRLPRLSRLTLMNADASLGCAPSPAVLLFALADGGGVSELSLQRYAGATDEVLAAAVRLMGGVKVLALGGCTVRFGLCVRACNRGVGGSEGCVFLRRGGGVGL